METTLAFRRAYHVTNSALRAGGVTYACSLIAALLAGFAPEVSIAAGTGAHLVALGCAGFALLSWCVEALVRRAEAEQPVSLLLEEEQIVAGERRLRIDAVERGWVDENQDVVIDEANGDRWTFKGLSAEERQALLEHAECGATERVLSARIYAPEATRLEKNRAAGCLHLLGVFSIAPAGFLVLGLPALLNGGIQTAAGAIERGQLMSGLTTLGITLAGAFGVMATCYALYRWLRPATVFVGTDGVRVERAFGHTFIAYRCIQRIERKKASFGGHAALIHRNDGEQVWVEGVSEAVFERLVELRNKACEAPEGRLRIEESLLRQGRDHQTWKEGLMALGQEGSGYRKTELTPDRLFAVAEDAAFSPEQRVASAFVLSQSSQPQTHRLRVLARSCADEELREALEEAAEGKLPELRLARVPEHHDAD